MSSTTQQHIDTLKAQIEVMEWFENGGEIEYRHKRQNAILEKYGTPSWKVCCKPCKPLWNFHSHEYRKRPEKVIDRADLLQDIVNELGDCPNQCRCCLCFPNAQLAEYHREICNSEVNYNSDGFFREKDLH